MDGMSYWALKNYTITRLTQVWLLSNELRTILETKKHQEKYDLKKILEADILQEPDLMKIAAEDGFKSVGDFEKLHNKDPERVKRIREQSRLKSAKAFRETNVQLYTDIYPDITWSSLSIMCLSVFELDIKLICRYLKLYLELDQSLSENYKLSIIERGKEFLQKIPNLNFDFGSSLYWHKIYAHKLIRNFVVHNGGFLDSSNSSEKIQKFIVDNDSSLEVKENRLEIEKEYINEIVEDCQNWLEELFDIIEKSFPHIENNKTR